MIAEIVATGEEIRSGALIDSNSAYIAGKLQENGVAVARHICVGDNLDVLVTVFREIGSRADVAVVTGGLGPTSDDLTAQAAAKAAGVNLALNPTALQSVENFFKSRGRKMNPASQKQAVQPAGATCLQNPEGTAPGFHLKIGQCQFYFLPGVPHEMRCMLDACVLAQLMQLAGSDRNYYPVRTMSIFGLPESKVFERLAGLEKAFPQVSLGMQVRFPEIRVKLYTSGADEQKLHANLESALQWVMNRMGHYMFSSTGDSLEKTVGHLLREANATLALAESCTAGLIADMLTNVAGSSDYFVFSGVTYSNQSKIDILGVSEETLKTHGAVHEETAREMAVGAKRVSGATYGLATSGIAGPTGGTEKKPVGTVCIGLATPRGSVGRRQHFGPGNRIMNKQMFAKFALEVLRRELLGIEPPQF